MYPSLLVVHISCTYHMAGSTSRQYEVSPFCDWLPEILLTCDLPALTYKWRSFFGHKSNCLWTKLMWSRWQNNGLIEGGGDMCQWISAFYKDQCEILMNLQLVDWGFIHFYFFGPGFWTLCVIKYFCQDFGLKSEILMEDLVNKSSRISGFAYPYSPLSSLHCYGLKEKCPKNSHLDFVLGQ